MIDLNKLEELARAARNNDMNGGSSLTVEFMAFVDELTPAVAIDLIALIRKQEAELAEARAESANSGTFQGAPSADTDELRNKLMYAAIDCGHSISHEEIILCCDDSKKGNALHQLSERLLAAAVAHGRKQGAAQDGGCAKHCGDVACDEACESHGAAQPGGCELPSLPEADHAIHVTDSETIECFRSDQTREYGRLCLAAGIEAAAKLCEEIAQDHWDQYKGRGKHAPNNLRRADPHADGCSDGANQCADAIRALNKPGGA